MFRWRITLKAALRGVNEMLGVGWMPHQPCHAFDDVSTPVFDSALVIVIPSHILQSVQFPLPNSLIIWHASHLVLYAIPVLEAGEMQSSDICPQHVVIVRLHACLLDPTLDIFVLFRHRKWVDRIILEVRFKATLMVTFPWLSNVIDQQSAGTWVSYRPR